MKSRTVKRLRYAHYYQTIAAVRRPYRRPHVRTAEEQAWLDIAPVGREFGSPDYTRLAAIEALQELQKIRGVAD